MLQEQTLEELQKDKTRLDWIINHLDGVIFFESDGIWRVESVSHALTFEEGKGNTGREAIDDAMKKEGM